LRVIGRLVKDRGLGIDVIGLEIDNLRVKLVDQLASFGIKSQMMKTGVGLVMGCVVSGADGDTLASDAARPHGAVRLLHNLLVAHQVDQQKRVELLACLVVLGGQADVADRSGLAHGRFKKMRKLVCVWD